MKIQRWDFTCDGYGTNTFESDDGPFVMYEDCAAEVERLNASRTLLHEHIDKIDGYNSDIEEKLDESRVEVERLTKERSRLWTQRERFDCHYAGPYAETSGMHCPLDQPCLRCENERLTADLAATRAERDGLTEALALERAYSEALKTALGLFLHRPPGVPYNELMERARAALAALPPKEDE